MSDFGYLVRQLRKRHELTLERLARKVGTHKGYLSGIENGKVRPPSVRFVRKLARALGTDEKEMILTAYLEKAPKEIKEDLKLRLSYCPIRVPKNVESSVKL